MSKKPFMNFIKCILKSAINIYSGISFLLIIISIFIEIPTKYKVPIQIAIVLSTFLYAIYLAWKETYNKIPQSGILTFNINNVSLATTSWHNGLPQNPTFKFEIDFQNRGKEKLIITKINQVHYNLNTQAINLEENSLAFMKINSEVSVRNQRIQLPIDVLKRDHFLISIELNAVFMRSNIAIIKKFYKHEDVFQFEYQVHYSDIDNNKKVVNIQINGEYTSFKKSLIDTLRKHGRNDILKELRVM